MQFLEIRNAAQDRSTNLVSLLLEIICQYGLTALQKSLQHKIHILDENDETLNQAFMSENSRWMFPFPILGIQSGKFFFPLFLNSVDCSMSEELKI